MRMREPVKPVTILDLHLLLNLKLRDMHWSINTTSQKGYQNDQFSALYNL
jgi:hypothetical protein